MTMFESGLGNKCKTFKVDRDFSENLTFHQLINTERAHSISKFQNKYFCTMIQHGKLLKSWVSFLGNLP